MNHHTIQLGATAALIVALTGCGVQESPIPDPAPADIGGPGAVAPSGPASQPDASPLPCYYSPAAVDHMLELGQPLPRCVQRATGLADEGARGGPGQP